MPAIASYGWISVIALFVALPALPQSQFAAAAPQPFAPSSYAGPPADVPSSDSVQASPSLSTEESKGDFLMIHIQYQAALDAYSNVSPPSAAVWNKMGIAYEMLFDANNAARCYKESLKIDPENAGALNNLATILDERKDFSAAERLYRKALQINSSSAQIFKNLGTNLLLQHKFRESSDAYAQALALDPHIFDSNRGPTIKTPVSIKYLGADSYVKARSCARAGLNDCAIVNLRQAFDEGSATKKQVVKDNDFEALRQTPEFERLLAEQR
jgi:tetratricopeptide (TPR) repeat protein